MKTSDKGIKLIKGYEGLRLTAYKPVSTEKYWTIGYGHYGPDVTQGMTINEAQAEAFLKADLASSEKAVMAYDLIYHWTQAQFDALVSFTFNCGAKNFKKLIENGKRTIHEISDAIPRYNKGGGKVLPGLTRRRNEEKTLFDSGTVRVTRTLKEGCKGSDVLDLQEVLNLHGADLKCDGVFGPATKEAVMHFQQTHALAIDGIVGAKTRAVLGL